MSTLGRSIKVYSERNLLDFLNWRKKVQKAIEPLNIFSGALIGFFKHTLEKSKFRREEIRLRGVNKSNKREIEQRIKRDWAKSSYFA